MSATERVRTIFEKMLSVDIDVLANDASVFQRGFLATLEANGGDRLSAVRTTMGILERMWDASQPVAGCLMIWLMPEAARCKAHNVYGAVALYLSSSSDQALASALDSMSNANIAPRFRRLAQSYASTIRQKAVEH